MRIMTLVEEEVPANFVPAAAVIREERALSLLIGRKGFVGCPLFVFCERMGLYLIKRLKLKDLSLMKNNRI